MVVFTRPHSRKVVLTNVETGAKQEFKSVATAKRFLHCCPKTVYLHWFRKQTVRRFSGEEYTIEIEIRDGECADTIAPSFFSGYSL